MKRYLFKKAHPDGMGSLHFDGGGQWVDYCEAIAEIEKARQEGYKEGYMEGRDNRLAIEEEQFAAVRKQGAAGERKRIVALLYSERWTGAAQCVERDSKPPAPPQLPEKLHPTDAAGWGEMGAKVNALITYLRAKEGTP